MEFFVVFLLGFLVSKLQNTQKLSQRLKYALVMLTVLAYALTDVFLAFRALPETRYAASGLRRSMKCEEVKSLYRTLAKEKHPDKNQGGEADFITFQENFDVLGSPTLRTRYELYNTTEDDALLKDLLQSLPFYSGALLISYGMTCNKNTVHAGMWTIVLIVLFGSVEWGLKSLPGTQPPYGWMNITVHDQLEIAKSLFYPVVLGLYIYSGVKHTTTLETKRRQWNEILKQVDYNRSVLATFSERYRAGAEPQEENTEERERVAKQLLATQMKKETSIWKIIFKVAVFGLIIYMFRNKQPAPQQRPPRWHSP